MRFTWIDRARQRVSEVDKDIPAEATIAERRKAMRAAGSLFHGGTYWGRKKWGQAVREYLQRHGAPRPISVSKDPRLLAAMERGDIVFPFRGEKDGGDSVPDREGLLP